MERFMERTEEEGNMLLRRSNADRGHIYWWGWVLIILGGLLVVLLTWWWLRRRTRKQAPPVTRIEITAPAHVAEGPTSAAEPAPPTPDDLKRIEGIGPKISSLLQEAGITTFAQLAATDVNRLRRILVEAGIRIAAPETWPEQASLAAAGRWDELETLQARLKGGRRA